MSSWEGWTLTFGRILAGSRTLLKGIPGGKYILRKGKNAEKCRKMQDTHFILQTLQNMNVVMADKVRRVS